MKKLVVGVVGAVALVTAGMAAAAATTSPVKSVASAPEQTFSNSAAGFYVNAGLGWGHVAQSIQDASSVSRNALAWAGFAGYQFNPYVALETGFIDFGHATQTYDGIGSAKESLYGFDVDAKGIYPVSNKLDVFGTAGVIRMTDKATGIVSGSTHAWTPDLGAGVAYHVMPTIDLTAQDVYAFKNSDKDIPAANAVLAGVSYKFNI